MKHKTASIRTRRCGVAHAVASAVGLSVLLGLPLVAQISPGPLARAHQQLEGVAKCAECHDFGAGSRSFRCLNCHTEIRRRVEGRVGFHSHAYKQSATQVDCVRCHMEHNGEAFALTRLDRKSFDHLAQTGFALAGKHRAQACEKCHNEKRIAASARPEIKLKDPNRSFLGLRRDCTACHEDRHSGQLGAECTRCHGQDAWKPAPGFDHSRTAFPLTGLHKAVLCQKCHGPRAGEERPRYKGLGSGGCQSCHNDPHHGGFREVGFQGACDSCHNTAGWKNAHLDKSFNHNSTKFPLTGRHAERACVDCHKNGDFRRPIAHGQCRDCHQDPHTGQFAARATGSDCSACHYDTGFKPSRFDAEMHRHSAFPLEGRHASLGCPQCHKPAGRATVYRTGKLICSACHADRHAGQFAAAPYFNRCDQCHATAGFQPAAFSVERHAQTSFPLTGRHVSVACRDCHKPMAQSSALLPVETVEGYAITAAWPRQYHFASRNCAACHTDPHQTRRPCEECHVTPDWAAVRPFDHTQTGFKVEGAHEKVKCVDCHLPSGPGHSGTGRSVPGFAVSRKQCFECHRTKDIHGGQFTSGGRQEDCGACHIAVRWDSSAFDHNRAVFALDVAHRTVACVKCHKLENRPDGKAVRMYRGTTTACVQCH